MFRCDGVSHSQDAVRRLFRADRDTVGNLTLVPIVLPDPLMPFLRTHEGARELTQMRWCAHRAPELPWRD